MVFLFPSPSFFDEILYAVKNEVPNRPHVK